MTSDPTILPAAKVRPDERTALRHYYDASTSRFLAIGGGGSSLAIHRGLWGAGVRTPEEAADRINALIVARLAELGAPEPAQVLDMGCGVGGTLFHLAKAWDGARLAGITLSERQATLAQGFARERGVDARCRVICGDYLRQAPDAPADLVVAIESHVHAPSATAFLSAAAAALRPGGHLVIVDDMLARPAIALTTPERRLVATFRRGWHLGHVPDPESLRKAAWAQGLTCIADNDLSHSLRLDRLRDRLLHLAAPVADACRLGRWPLFSNMIGGNALTLAHRRKVMQYRMMIFSRHDVAAAPAARPGDAS